MMHHSQENEEEENEIESLLDTTQLNPFEIQKNLTNKNRADKNKYTKKKKSSLAMSKIFGFGFVIFTIVCFIFKANIEMTISSSKMFNSNSSVDDLLLHADDLSITSYNELDIHDIKYWCLDSNAEEQKNETISKCECANPLVPKEKKGYKTWNEAHLLNIEQLVNNASQDRTDVIFFGDSITEGWNGMSFGQLKEEKKEKKQVFLEYFRNSSMPYQGIAMGISGDKSNNLLWRIQNGEMDTQVLTPSIAYWLLIGTNDFAYTKDTTLYCSEEVVLMGIIRVIEEMKGKLKDLKKDEKPKIVVQALLPRADNEDDPSSRQNGILINDQKKNRYMAILEINEKLQAFCENDDDLVFVNLNELFIDQNQDGDEYIPVELMDDYLHPSPLGYQIWAERIIQVLDSLKEN